MPTKRYSKFMKLATGQKRIQVRVDPDLVVELRPVLPTALSADALLVRWCTMPSVDPVALRADIDCSLDATL